MFNKPLLPAVVTFQDGKSFEVQIQDDGRPPLDPDTTYVFKTAANGNDLAARGSSIAYIQIVGDSGQVDNPVE